MALGFIDGELGFEVVASSKVGIRSCKGGEYRKLEL